VVKFVAMLGGLAFLATSCKMMGGSFEEQPQGPNLVYIEGGRMVLGSFEEDILLARDNLERTVTVASFYMDETEVANIHWLEYMFYAKGEKSFTDSAAQAAYIKSITPREDVWEGRLAFNDPYQEYYLRFACLQRPSGNMPPRP